MKALALGLLAAAATFFLVAAADRDAADPPRAAAIDGRAVFARVGCGNCHTLAAAGSQGQIGPNLDARLADHNATSLRAKILDPGAGSGGFAVMPTNFGERLRPGELDALVAFLVEAGRR